MTSVYLEMVVTISLKDGRLSGCLAQQFIIRVYLYSTQQVGGGGEREREAGHINWCKKVYDVAVHNYCV